MSNKIDWYLSRLKVMNIKEIFWRLSQKFINYYENVRYCSNPLDVCSIKYGNHLSFNINNLKLHINKNNLSTDYNQELIAGLSYKDYKDNWFFNYNSCDCWPSIPSYKINYRTNDFGDVRINWELNRHHQFPILAKNYCITKDKKYLKELNDLFYDWNKSNPFLIGISWTNSLEIAIRCINWIFTYYFIYEVDKENIILKDLQTGIINMSNYVYKHISKYSSANNHTIGELSAVLITAILTNNKSTINKTFSKLTKELKHQHYADGVNKEQSLHYEAFSLEALLLSAKVLKDNNFNINCWKDTITNICKYVSDCLNNDDLAIEFGDNDDGYFIRLGKEKNYYKYVVNLAFSIFNTPYSLNYNSETLSILSGQNEFLQNTNYNYVSSYKDGGITLIRDDDILIGIDHGSLGFEPLAAHGHSDALSFQIILENKYLLIDPGTYGYQIDKEKRNYYRSTINHNTVCINNTNQSEIQGPFLWGHKANVELVNINYNDNKVDLLAKHDGYGKPIFRHFTYSDNIFTIQDNIDNKVGVANFSFGSECNLKIENNIVRINLNNKEYTMCFNGDIDIIEEKVKYYSPHYGKEYSIPAIEVTFKNTLTTNIILKDSIDE